MDNDNKRNASDVLLALEQKIDILLNTLAVVKQDMLVMSSKLNILMSNSEKSARPDKIIVEAVQKRPTQVMNAAMALDPERNIPISGGSQIPMTSSPDGLRRSSRPETHASNVAKVSSSERVEMQKIVEFKDHPVATVPDHKDNKNTATDNTPPPVVKTFAVQQKCLDKNNKALFMASVEVIDATSLKRMSNTRTNGAGNWQAALPPGKYKARIKKASEAGGKTMEVQQNFVIDGSTDVVELNAVVVK